MRIAQICPPWLAVPPRGYGGIEWVVSLLADGLAERGHEVTLFASGDSVTKADLAAIFPEAPGPERINDIELDAIHSMFALRDARSFDVLHVHSPFAALAGAAQSGVTTVHTVHGSFTERMRLLYRQVLDRVHFVAISEAQRRTDDELRYSGVVHNGIDLDRYPLGDGREDFVLFLGRAAPEKGWLRAVETCRRSGDRLVSAVKIATPEEHAEYEERVRPALPRDAEVHLEVDHETKVDLLRRAKAVLFPIDWPEPFGLVMTEAMACGTPVIATDRGSVPEVIEHGVTGWILPVEGYEDAAAELLGRTGEIGPAACRARVERYFSKATMVAGYERAYAAALEGADG
ncbi:MAG: glycosyltransferase family 4 protein [Actinomycetota bacterium]